MFQILFSSKKLNQVNKVSKYAQLGAVVVPHLPIPFYLFAHFRIFDDFKVDQLPTSNFEFFGVANLISQHANHAP
jgi:hypothetical protein